MSIFSRKCIFAVSALLICAASVPAEIASAALSINENVRAVRWIDRLADVPEAGMAFYSELEEGSDNDGYNDFLIDPSIAEKK